MTLTPELGSGEGHLGSLPMLGRVKDFVQAAASMHAKHQALLPTSWLGKQMEASQKEPSGGGASAHQSKQGKASQGWQSPSSEENAYIIHKGRELPASFLKGAKICNPKNFAFEATAPLAPSMLCFCLIVRVDRRQDWLEVPSIHLPAPQFTLLAG